MEDISKSMQGPRGPPLQRIPNHQKQDPWNPPGYAPGMECNLNNCKKLKFSIVTLSSAKIKKEIQVLAIHQTDSSKCFYINAQFHVQIYQNFQGFLVNRKN